MKSIRNWPKFARQIRNKEGVRLLEKLDEFPNSILVSGCQRSGTTILSNVITASDGMVNFVTGRDSELDAALILAGQRSENSATGRYCFQTTYLNECYPEYYSHKDNFKLVWVVRNPYSVICSILYNWGRFAFNELFESCGIQYLSKREMQRYNRFGHLAIPKLKRACFAYNGKVSQLFEIEQQLNNRLLVIDYDHMIMKKNETLEKVYEFVDLDYKPQYGEVLSAKSIGKSRKLTEKQRGVIDEICSPIYHQAKSYALRV